MNKYKKDILDFLKDQYQKQDNIQVLLETKIDKKILGEAKEKNQRQKNETL